LFDIVYESGWIDFWPAATAGEGESIIVKCREGGLFLSSFVRASFVIFVEVFLDDAGVGR
jgi:hypothetical protein